MGKGSKQRPTDRKKYAEGYERVFRGSRKLDPFFELYHFDVDLHVKAGSATETCCGAKECDCKSGKHACCST